MTWQQRITTIDKCGTNAATGSLLQTSSETTCRGFFKPPIEINQTRIWLSASVIVKISLQNKQHEGTLPDPLAWQKCSPMGTYN